MNPFQLDRAQAEHEARAKIFWGDPPDKVFDYLMGQGIHPEDAQVMVDSMLVERTRAIRGSGVRKILAGCALIAVPILTYALLASSGFFSLRIFALSLAVGLWGGWKVMKGSFLFFGPQSEPGDVADL